jgi:hypothetical protein
MMKRIYLRRPATLTLSREQILVGLRHGLEYILNKEVRHALKRARQKLSLALVDLDAMANKEATVVLTELEISALSDHIECSINFGLEGVPYWQLPGLRIALIIASWKERSPQYDEVQHLERVLRPLQDIIFAYYGGWALDNPVAKAMLFDSSRLRQEMVNNLSTNEMLNGLRRRRETTNCLSTEEMLDELRRRGIAVPDSVSTEKTSMADEWRNE